MIRSRVQRKMFLGPEGLLSTVSRDGAGKGAAVTILITCHVACDHSVYLNELSFDN